MKRHHEVLVSPLIRENASREWSLFQPFNEITVVVGLCFLLSGSAEATLHWGDYEMIDWERVVSGELRASSYCIRKASSTSSPRGAHHFQKRGRFERYRDS